MLSTALATGVRRKSKVDAPIALAAEAPFTDNVATASGNEPQIAKDAVAPAVVAAAEKQSPNSNAATTSAQQVNADNEDECDSDLIGFEIITG